MQLYCVWEVLHTASPETSGSHIVDVQGCGLALCGLVCDPLAGSFELGSAPSDPIKLRKSDKCLSVC
jgi:hypothetical protein